MGLVAVLELVLQWDGYQCGYCGEEFKTAGELTQHQLSRHPDRGTCPPSLS